MKVSRTTYFLQKRFHVIVYAIFIAFIVLDLATTLICFQISGLTEANPIYRIVGAWAFPIAYLIDAGFILAVEWLRRYIRWSPIVLFILIFAYVRASIINLNLILGG